MESPQDTELRLELARRFVELTRTEMDHAQKRWVAAMEELDLAQKASHAARRAAPMYVPV